jgi:hypothetical protein
MKVCGKCKGLGSVPAPDKKGSTNRCKDCNGTGLEAVSPVETKNQEPSTKSKE